MSNKRVNPETLEPSTPAVSVRARFPGDYDAGEPKTTTMTGSNLARRLLRPFVRPVLRSLDAHLDARLAPVVAQSQALAHRLEFVRKEVLLELRYERAGANQPAALEPSLLHPERLEAMAGDIRLNLGAGHLPHPDYLNVDTRPLDGIDLVADVRALPFDEDSLAEVYSAHVLEHFPVEELRRVLLPYWVSLLRPGGSFVAVVPDLDTMIIEYSAGRLPFEELREVLYGSQEYEGDFHHNGFTQSSIRALFEQAGLTGVEVRAFGRRNGMCYEMEVAGVRAGPPDTGV